MLVQTETWRALTGLVMLRRPEIMMFLLLECIKRTVYLYSAEKPAEILTEMQVTPMRISTGFPSLHHQEAECRHISCTFIRKRKKREIKYNIDITASECLEDKIQSLVP